MPYCGAASRLPANSNSLFTQLSVSGSFLWTARHWSSPVQCWCMLHFANWVTLEPGQWKWLPVTLRPSPADAEGSHQPMVKHRVCCADCNSWGEPWDIDRQMVCEWRRNTSGNSSLGFAQICSGSCDTRHNTHPGAWIRSTTKKDDLPLHQRRLHNFIAGEDENLNKRNWGAEARRSCGGRGVTLQPGQKASEEYGDFYCPEWRQVASVATKSKSTSWWWKASWLPSFSQCSPKPTRILFRLV